MSQRALLLAAEVRLDYGDQAVGEMQARLYAASMNGNQQQAELAHSALLILLASIAGAHPPVGRL